MKRREFLQLGTSGIGATMAGGTAWMGLIEKALALPPHNPTGTPGLADIEHVVIFMQENRSFDHYLGSVPAVRGFGDPRPVPIPSGNHVWYQPEGTSPSSRGFSSNVSYGQWTSPNLWYQTNRTTQSNEYVLPFDLNASGDVAFQYITDLNHSWKDAQTIWGNWDSWVPLKSRQSMGFLSASDLPFYHSLANAFTVCDAYHCSVFAATDPNRFYLWSGTCPPPMNFPDAYTNGGYVSDITHDNNVAIKPTMYGQSAAARNAAVAAGVADWKTYPETLTEAGITWKVYQEYDNYGDNYLQYFKNFRIDNTGAPISQSTDPYFQTLYLRGRVFAPQGAKIGDAVIAQFARDVAAGMEPDNPNPGTVKPGLPRVSWIVAPYDCCEHPSASPGDGEAFTARLLDVLVNQHPEVFRKTAFFMMYDENDGYFDHVPAPIPPISANYGRMTVSDAGADENMSSVPVGLGPRVPLLVISPWTKGGKVSSRVSDHTSTLRFLERWLPAKKLASPEAVHCELISPWRRAVCGDLTEAFDFSKAASASPINTTTTFVNGVEHPAVPSPQVFPVLVTGLAKAACPLGYRFSVEGKATAPSTFSLSFCNTGSSAVSLIAYWMPMADAQAPYHYMIEPGKSLTDSPVAVGSDGLYDWAVYGPNGFLREFRGSPTSGSQLGQSPEVAADIDADGRIRINLDNRHGRKPCVFQLSDNAYYQNRPVEIAVAAGRMESVSWVGFTNGRPGVGPRGGWYDLAVRIAEDAVYLRRLAGCAQSDARELTTDPANGNPDLFNSVLRIHRMASNTLRFDYVAPPWNHRPTNWIGVFKRGAATVSGAELLRVYAPKAVGSVTASSSGLSPGDYDVWYFSDDGYTALVGPTRLTLRGHRPGG